MNKEEDAEEIIRRLRGEFNLLDDLKYFEKTLYISLKVPIEYIYIDIKVDDNDRRR